MLRIKNKIPFAHLFSNTSNTTKETHNQCDIYLIVRGDNNGETSIYLKIIIPEWWKKIIVTGYFGILNEKNNLCNKVLFDQVEYDKKGNSFGCLTYSKVATLSKYIIDDIIEYCFEFKKFDYITAHLDDIYSLIFKIKRNDRDEIQTQNNNLLFKDSQESDKSGNVTEKINNLAPQEKIKNLDLNKAKSDEIKNLDLNKCTVEELYNLQNNLTELLTKIIGKIKELNECTICMNNKINSILIPCGHKICCLKCGEKVKECPCCRHQIEQIIKIYE